MVDEITLREEIKKDKKKNFQEELDEYIINKENMIQKRKDSISFLPLVLSVSFIVLIITEILKSEYNIFFEPVEILIYILFGMLIVININFFTYEYKSKKKKIEIDEILRDKYIVEFIKFREYKEKYEKEKENILKW